MNFRAQATKAASGLSGAGFFTATGIASMIGPLLFGHIIDYTGNYFWGIITALVTGLLGFFAVVGLKPERSAGQGIPGTTR